MITCDTCRFMSKAGCRKNTCPQERCKRLAEHKELPKGPPGVAAPEPMGPDGLAGWLILWGNGLSKEFPPTEAGERDAYIHGSTLASTGIAVSMAELYRDCDVRETA
jgi:hypothetical protein